MREIYQREFRIVAKRALSMWNREPASPSCGPFDRLYWGWKFKDFSDATLQFAVRLAVEYAKSVNMTSMLPFWLESYVGFCKKIQHKDGSFDQCYPNEKTPGVVYDILSTLVYVRKSELLDSDNLKSELDGVISRAVDYVLKVDERHGEIANHIAEFAYELLGYYQYSGDERARKKGELYVERLLSLFVESEGWFQEYGGPDPGYQTRTMRFLAKCADMPGGDELWAVLKKAGRFVGEVMMPDGSIHPMLGARSTALLYPSSLEVLGSRDSGFKELAMRARNAWCNSRVPLPSELDFANAIRLADDALDASRAASTNSGSEKESFVYEVREGKSVDFPKAGIMVERQPDMIVYVGYRIGGTVVVYVKDDIEWNLKYEDGGYLAESAKKTEMYVTTMPGTGSLESAGAEGIRVRVPFSLSLHDELTPLRMVALRIMNLTILRFEVLADLFRVLIVNKLMQRRKTIPLEMVREIRIGGDFVSIYDQIAWRDGASHPGWSLYRCRRLIGQHMASSRYFQFQELRDVGESWIRKVEWDGSSPAEEKTEVSCAMERGEDAGQE